MLVIRRYRSSPFREFEHMHRRMSRFLEDDFTRTAMHRRADRHPLPVDVYATDTAFVVRADVPGVTPDEVDVTIEGDTVNIKANLPEPQEDVDYSLRERTGGQYARSLRFRVPIEPEAASATFENGVLTLNVPKAQSARPTKIDVKAN
jgi:HSP20 family protein